MIRAERGMLGALALACLVGCADETPRTPARSAAAPAENAPPACQLQRDTLADMARGFVAPGAPATPALLTPESERIQQAQLAFLDLMACRRNEAQKIHARFDRGELTMDDANAAILDIRSRITEDYGHAGEMIAGLTRRSEQAATLLEAAAPPPVPSAPPSVTGLATVTRETAIRTEASEMAARIGSLAPGDQVRILAARGNWRRIALPDDASGFVQASALSVTPPAEAPRPATTTAGLDPADRARLQSLLQSETAARQDFESAIAESRRQLLVPQTAANR